MIHQHKNLTEDRWKKLSFAEQLANIGSEVSRTINWRERNKEYSEKAFERALELLDLSINIQKKTSRLKELTRLREALADYFAFDNIYKSSDDLWKKYFYAFNYAARLNC